MSWNVKLSHALCCHIGEGAHVPTNQPDETYWRERAREAVALADRMTHPQAKRIMMEIAAGYQRLGQMTEERTGRIKAGGRR
jgi:hypothetical protein